MPQPLADTRTGPCTFLEILDRGKHSPARPAGDDGQRGHGLRLRRDARAVEPPEAARALSPRAPALPPGTPTGPCLAARRFAAPLPRRTESMVRISGAATCSIRRVFVVPAESISSTVGRAGWGPWIAAVRFICFEYFPSLSAGSSVKEGWGLGVPVMRRCRCRRRFPPRRWIWDYLADPPISFVFHGLGDRAGRFLALQVDDDGSFSCITARAPR
jgi:hypothetical protein